MHINAKRVRLATIVATLTAVSLVAGTVQGASPASDIDKIEDTETVYVMMDAAGSVKNTVVVDWLHIQGSGSASLVDPAPGVDKVESLTDEFEPTLSDGSATADITVDGTGDFFYRAETDAELPLDIDVVYTLDGARIPADQLAGKSGRLRIDISIHNKLERTETITFEDADGAERSAEVTYTVPILCLPQFVVDGRQMLDVVVPDEAQIMVTGSTRTYVVPILPSPDATATIEMDAEDIELEPTVIVALPMLPASPDFSTVGELHTLRDGLGQLGQLSQGHLQVVEGLVAGMDSYDLSGTSAAAEGLTELQSALGQMASGTTDLATLSEAQLAYLDGVIAGIDTSQFDSLVELQAAIGQMALAASQLETGTQSLVTLLDGQIGLVEQLRASNTALAQKAVQLSEANPGDADLQGLAAGLQGQDALITVLLDGGDPDGPGPAPAVPGLRETRDQLVGIGSGLTALEDGLSELETRSAALSAVPQAFEQLKSALVVLRDGGIVQGQQFPGLSTTTSGLKSIADGLSQASSGMSESATTLDTLGSLPAMMGDLRSALETLAQGGSLEGQELPGITTTVEALGEMAGGLGAGVDEMSEGEALVGAMKAAAANYTTFLGLPEGAVGHLSFLFKLDGVSKEVR